MSGNSWPRWRRFTFLLTLGLSARLAAADVPPAHWPEVPPERLSEDIFALRFRVKHVSGGAAGARKFLVEEMTKKLSPAVKTYLGWVSLFSEQWEIPAIVEPAAAAVFLQQAYDEGSVLAADVLGRAKIFGVGVSRDEEAGMKLLEEAAGKGLPRAMAKLGYFHVVGFAGRHNIDYGVKLIKQASALGADSGLIDVAEAFETGKIAGSLPRERAMQYYVLLAEKNVGLGWKKLDEYVEKNVSSTVYFRALAQVRFANVSDVFVPARVKQQLAVLEQSATLEPRGCVEIGVAYLTGEFVKKDYSKALAYLQRGKQDNVSDASVYLAYAKLMGRGLPREPQVALEEMEALAAAGNGRAALLLAQYYYWGASEIPGLKKDPLKSFRYCQQAVAAGFIQALSSLAECYEHGIGTPKNYAFAAKVQGEAADRGVRDGYEQMRRNLAFVKN